MILLTPYPPDIRVEKEILTLRKKHEVFLLCPRRHGKPTEEHIGGLQIRRVFSTPGRWWNNWRLVASCQSSGWEREIRKYIENFRLDALHVHDLPLLGPALRAAKALRLRVVVDLHENYPQMLAEALKTPLSKTLTPASLVERLSVSIERWKQYEVTTVPQADKVIVVIEEARERLIRLDVPPERIHVVPNYDDCDSASAENVEEISPHKAEQFRVIYAGGFSASRDLRTVIDAVAEIPISEMPTLQVLIVGGKGAELTSLRQYVEKKDVKDRIVVDEWQPIEAIRASIRSAQIGLVPHVKSAHTDATIPHKLFQYMGGRLPVIVSNCAPLERIVTECQAGLVYQSGDSGSLAACLKYLYVNPALREKMGNSGYQAARTKYSWKVAGEQLLEVYRQLSAS